ncbi:MAG TPA: hypothetical protein VES89_14020 [Candidatus Competibacteraceae bacterium]|nr:hypothetical protein [Candidatus Competibacteraceae bacterium]
MRLPQHLAGVILGLDHQQARWCQYHGIDLGQSASTIREKEVVQRRLTQPIQHPRHRTLAGGTDSLEIILAESHV